MSDSRPISRASAPQEPPSKLTGETVTHASSAEPKTPVSTSQLNDTDKASDLPASSIQNPAPLNALARLLGRQLARATSREEGRDD